MIRQLLDVYWFMLRQVRARTFKQFRHRLKLEWSFQINRRALHRHMAQEVVCKENRQAIVISQVVHLGDIVACEPVVRQVRRQAPGAFIVFALDRSYRELADTHPEIDHVLPLTCVTEWSWFASSRIFDHIIDLNIDGRTCDICGLPWHTPGGTNGVTAYNYYNHGNLLEAYCKSAGFTAPAEGPRINLRPEDKIFVDNLNLADRFVVLHATSNEHDRELPVIVWKHIVSYINNHWKLPVVEIGLKSIVISTQDVTNRSLCDHLSILQSAEVIRRGLLYLGTDSGPAHLANAVGSFGIIVLGKYRDFQRYTPYSGSYAQGKHCELLYHDGPVAEIPLSRIIAAIDRRLNAC